MTPLGAMRANSPGIAHELSWSLERLSEAFREVSVKGMVMVDERVSCVFLPNFVKHNLPESPNVILAWEKCLDDIPDCSLKNKAIHTAREVSLTMSEAFQKACGRLPEVFRKGMPNQEQEPEPEPEQEQEPLKAFCAGCRVAIFSTEMTEEQNVARILANTTGVNANVILSGQMNDNHKERVDAHKLAVAAMGLNIYDKLRDVDDIMAQCRKLAQRGNCMMALDELSGKRWLV